jgi:hypothetical protein
MMPQRIWSLWDIMNFFCAQELSIHLGILTIAEGQYAIMAHIAKCTGKPAPGATEIDKSATISALKNVFSYCGLGHVPEKIQLSLQQFEKNEYFDLGSMSTELRNVREAVHMELGRHRFLRILPERSNCTDNKNLLGDEVATAFPSAVPDIREAGNCLAAECNTAAVFHLMRAVEWGLRALCAELGIRRVKHKIKKSGRICYTPIEYAEWERILDELQGRVDKKIQRLKRGVGKQDLQQFYYPALQDIRAIRDAWRNHVMHTRDEYTHEDADGILSHVKRLMNSLATRVSEV